MSAQSGLYGELAPYYDKIYHWKDYRKEAVKIRKIIDEYKQSKGNSLLDVACGTGKHISLLRKDFQCFGVDTSEDMLTVARRNNRGVKFVRASMSDFNMGRKFDVVICLFSSIGYLRTKAEIRRAFSNFSRHLKHGGILIVEPWIRKSEWIDQHVSLHTYDSDSLKIARVAYSWGEGGFSISDYRYVIAEKGKGIQQYRDVHKVRFFEPDWALDEMRKVGLDAKFTEDSLMPGRGLLLATKTKDRIGKGPRRVN